MRAYLAAKHRMRAILNALLAADPSILLLRTRPGRPRVQVVQSSRKRVAGPGGPEFWEPAAERLNVLLQILFFNVPELTVNKHACESSHSTSARTCMGLTHVPLRPGAGSASDDVREIPCK